MIPLVVSAFLLMPQFKLGPSLMAGRLLLISLVVGILVTLGWLDLDLVQLQLELISNQIVVSQIDNIWSLVPAALAAIYYYVFIPKSTSPISIFNVLPFILLGIKDYQLGLFIIGSVWFLENMQNELFSTLSKWVMILSMTCLFLVDSTYNQNFSIDLNFYICNGLIIVLALAVMNVKIILKTYEKVDLQQIIIFSLYCIGFIYFLMNMPVYNDLALKISLGFGACLNIGEQYYRSKKIEGVTNLINIFVISWLLLGSIDSMLLIGFLLLVLGQEFLNQNAVLSISNKQVLEMLQTNYSTVALVILPQFVALLVVLESIVISNEYLAIVMMLISWFYIKDIFKQTLVCIQNKDMNKLVIFQLCTFWATLIMIGIRIYA